MARPKSTAVKTTGVKRRGRPPKSAAAKKTAGKKTAVKSKVAGKGPSMTVRMRELKQENRVVVKALKVEVAALKKELSASQRQEAKLVKVFEDKEKAVAAFGAKWQAKALKTATPKKTRRRKVKKV
jgi:hypothetical protein